MSNVDRYDVFAVETAKKKKNLRRSNMVLSRKQSRKKESKEGTR